MHWRSSTCRFVAIAAVFFATFAGSAAASPVPVTATPYGAPGTATDSNGTVLTVLSGTAGMQYTAQLDPSRSYNVTVTGTAMGATYRMRIGRDSDPGAYRLAPDGTQVIHVNGTTRFSLLIYASAGQYRVSSVTIDDCTGVCKGDSDLKQQVLNDTPGLSSALASGDTWTAGKLILHWAAPRIPWSNQGSLMFDPTGLDAAQMYYSYLQPVAGGLYCYGASEFLRKLLTIFGIPNFEFQFGTAAQDLTHATVVLPYPNASGGTDYRILDPTFDVDYSYASNGAPASMPSMWELWRAGSMSQIVPNKASLAARPIITGQTSSGPLSYTTCGAVPTNTGCGLDAYNSEFGPTYTADGLQAPFPGFVQLMGTQAVFSLSYTQLPAAVQSMHSTFANAVATNQANVHVVPLALPPNATGPASVSGYANVGSTLTASAPWTPGYDPIVSWGAQWSRCDATGAGCQAIAGATGPSYVPVDADQGHVLQVTFTAANDAGSAPTMTAATPAAVGAKMLPVATGTANVSGTPQDGQVLSADQGSFTAAALPISYSYQWSACDAAGANCQPLAGATGAQLTLPSQAVGHTVVATVTASNQYGSASETSAPTATVAGVAPQPSQPPALPASAQDGQTLTAPAGTWSGTTPMTYAYQWSKCDSAGANCAPISGATASTYTIGSASIGATLVVTVTATNAIGNASTTSSAVAVTGAPPLNRTPPGISGSAQDGATLSETSSWWTGTQPFSYSQRWYRCAADGTGCQVISGANGYTYQVQTGDIGSTIRVRLTTTNTYGSSYADSRPTPVITGAAPQDQTVPGISGTPQDGQMLQETSSWWTGTQPFSYSHQWYRCAADGSACSPIQYYTADFYTAQPIDVGHTLKVRVTTSNSYGSSSVDSTLTAVVTAAPPQATAAPVVSLAPAAGGAAVRASAQGAPQDGQTLTATSGTWTGTAPISFGYQWSQCDANGANCGTISGANASSYTLGSQAVGKTLEVTVTGQNAGGQGTSTSQPTAVVAGAPPSYSQPPAVSGAAQDGQTLTATPGTWSGTPTISYAYQWSRCTGTTCTAITGATAATYQAAAADVGQTLQVTVTATNPYGSGTASASTPTTVAPAPPSNLSPPTLDPQGAATQDGQLVWEGASQWTGTQPITYASQWYRCAADGTGCTVITGASGDRYRYTSADVGSRVRVAMSASNAAGSATASSPLSGVVAGAPPANAAQPAISGTAVVGQQLSAASRGRWTGTTPITLTLQWVRCSPPPTGSCQDITGATGFSYRVTSLDSGKTIAMRVTATNPYGSASATSPPSAQVP